MVAPANNSVHCHHQMKRQHVFLCVPLPNCTNLCALDLHKGRPGRKVTTLLDDRIQLVLSFVDFGSFEGHKVPVLVFLMHHATQRFSQDIIFRLAVFNLSCCVLALLNFEGMQFCCLRNLFRETVSCDCTHALHCEFHVSG
jgi:hypothetical protein